MRARGVKMRDRKLLPVSRERGDQPARAGG
jgi:hypothetical protein